MIRLPLVLAVLSLVSSAAAAPPSPLVSEVEAFLRETDPAKRRDLLVRIREHPFSEVEDTLGEVRLSREAVERRQVVHAVAPTGETRSTYVLAVPPGYDPSRRYPLLVAVHGAGSNAAFEERVWRPLTDANGWILVCPDGDPERSSAGWGSTDAERSAILDAVRDVRRRVSLDPDRVYLAGESRGGHAAWELGLLYPDLWAGLRICVGGPRVMFRPAVENLIPVGVYDVQGARDDPRLVAAVREACAALEEGGGDVTYVEAPELGHQDVPGEREKFFAWAASRRRRLMRREVTFVLGEGGGRRAFWLEADRLESKVPDPRKAGLAVRGVDRGASLEEKRRAYVEQLGRKLARIEARVDGPNRIVVRTRGVKSFTVYLSDELFDLDHPVEIVHGGRTRRVTVTRSVAFLLEHVRETGDPSRLFGAKATLR